MTALLANLIPLAVMAALAYLTAAWMNARSGVAHYEDMVRSYEGYVRHPWRDARDRERCLATLIKHRRSLRRARTCSWPFPIRTDRTIIEGATDDEKRVDGEVAA